MEEVENGVKGTTTPKAGMLGKGSIDEKQCILKHDNNEKITNQTKEISNINFLKNNESQTRSIKNRTRMIWNVRDKFDNVT